MTVVSNVFSVRPASLTASAMETRLVDLPAVLLPSARPPHVQEGLEWERPALGEQQQSRRIVCSFMSWLDLLRFSATCTAANAVVTERNCKEQFDARMVPAFRKAKKITIFKKRFPRAAQISLRITDRWSRSDVVQASSFDAVDIHLSGKRDFSVSKLLPGKIRRYRIYEPAILLTDEVIRTCLSSCTELDLNGDDSMKMTSAAFSLLPKLQRLTLTDFSSSIVNTKALAPLAGQLVALELVAKLHTVNTAIDLTAFTCLEELSVTDCDITGWEGPMRTVKRLLVAYEHRPGTAVLPPFHRWEALEYLSLTHTYLGVAAFERLPTSLVEAHLGEEAVVWGSTQDAPGGANENLLRLLGNVKHLSVETMQKRAIEHFSKHELSQLRALTTCEWKLTARCYPDALQAFPALTTILTLPLTIPGSAMKWATFCNNNAQVQRVRVATLHGTAPTYEHHDLYPDRDNDLMRIRQDEDGMFAAPESMYYHDYEVTAYETTVASLELMQFMLLAQHVRTVEFAISGLAARSLLTSLPALSRSSARFMLYSLTDSWQVTGDCFEIHAETQAETWKAPGLDRPETRHWRLVRA